MEGAREGVKERVSERHTQKERERESGARASTYLRACSISPTNAQNPRIKQCTPAHAHARAMARTRTHTRTRKHIYANAHTCLTKTCFSTLEMSVHCNIDTVTRRNKTLQHRQ